MLSILSAIAGFLFDNSLYSCSFNFSPFSNLHSKDFLLGPVLSGSIKLPNPKTLSNPSDVTAFPIESGTSSPAALASE